MISLPLSREVIRHLGALILFGRPAALRLMSVRGLLGCAHRATQLSVGAYVRTVDPSVFVQINDVLCRFFLSFDNRDWPSMTECLAPQITIDYSSSGRENPSTMSGHDFVRRRQDAVDNLAKHHSFSNLLLTRQSDESMVSARCNYLILRFDRSQQLAAMKEDFFHSCGSYEFLLEDIQGHWKISSIKQNALQSWGNASLHGGTPKEGNERSCDSRS